jgi:glyoxylase-like metal-dependent hydrolase (beta-lactamase superfamily II)
VATSPELIAPGVYRVDAVGLRNMISVLLLEDGDGYTLVDTGLASSAGRIRVALISLGAGPENLKRIYLTHHHGDHIGGLPGVREWAPNAELVAPEREAEIISGRREPDERPNPIIRSLDRRQKLPTAPVDRTVSEGDVVAGLRVISTPGHTLGHTSLLRDEDGLLFTADVFGVAPRKLRVGIRKVFCTDPAEAKRSAEKLLGEDFGTVAFSHGKPLRAGAKETLREVVARCRY